MKALAPLQKFTEELASLQGMINVQINVYDYDSVHGNESSRSITHVNGSIFPLKKLVKALAQSQNSKEALASL